MIRLPTSLVVMGLIVAAPAIADEACSVPMAVWQPRNAVERLAERNGWQVKRIRLDDGCYEVMATDAQRRPIEVKLHPATLAVIEMEIEDDSSGADDD